MNILHITDLHYNSESFEKFTQHSIIEKLVESIKTQNLKIDIVFFTGDLVFNGTLENDFTEARIKFIDKIVNGLNIDKNQFIICAGNHDIDRSSKSISLEKFFETEITSESALNKFITSRDTDYINSINSIKNYNNFINSFYEFDKIKNDLYNIHIRKIGNEDIAILSLNSAWRCMDNDSEGKLLFPIKLLEDVIFDLREFKHKFLIIHHPLHWFKKFNVPNLQALLYKNFNGIFSGHVHESEISTQYYNSNGIFLNVSPASLDWDKNYIGYSIFQFDYSNPDISTIHKFKFINESNHFIKIDSIVSKVPCGVEKEEQNKLNEKIFSKYSNELYDAKNLMLINESEDKNETLFIDKFNIPRLKTKPKEEINESNVLIDEFNFTELFELKNNYIIYGNDKSGKTVLLKYLLINFLEQFIRKGTIPFYLDFKIIEGKSIFDLIRYYYELSNNNTEKIIKSKFIILVDNFDSTSSQKGELFLFMKKYPSINFIFTCDYITYKIFQKESIADFEFSKLYFHDIKRTDVRGFLQKNEFNLGDRFEDVLNKVIKFCDQLELPMNYWTISVILLIHKKQKFDVSKNIYNLLDLCVDELLDKKHLTLKNSKLDFKQLKKICGKISVFLLIENANTIYSKDYNLVLNFLNEYLDKEFRIKAYPNEILEYLINTGILKNKNEQISFRLNGIFEFFIGYEMSENEKFRNLIITDDNLFLSFKNEFEICSGILYDNIDFYNIVYKKTKDFFNPINQKYRNQGTPDLILKSIAIDKNDINYNQVISQLNSIDPENIALQDEIIEQNRSIVQSEIHIKRIYDISNFNSEIYERYISIFTKVFKTMEGIKNEKILANSLDFILETYINYSFFLYSEFDNTEEININENILHLISKILPFISQISLTENIAHYNIEKILLKEIEKLEKDTKNNQYKLFVLYFVLLDIDDDNILKYTDKIIEIIDFGILKYSVVVKLQYYFSFKGKDNNKLKMFLKEKIKMATFKLNKNVDLSSLQNKLDTHKFNSK